MSAERRRYDPTKDPQVIRKMADLLRGGATMLAEHCPVCGLPLFRLRSGEVVCPIHGRVYIARNEAEVTRATVEGVLEQLERLLVEKISSGMRELREVEFGEEEKPRALIIWLEALERVERLLKDIRGQQGVSEKGAKSREESGRRRE